MLREFGVSAMLRDETTTLGSPVDFRKIPEMPVVPSPNSYAGHPPFSDSVLLDHGFCSGCCSTIEFSTLICSTPPGPYVRYSRDALRTPRITSPALRLFCRTRLHPNRGMLIGLPFRSVELIGSLQYAAAGARVE